MANGVRLIFLLLIPSAVLMAVLAEPITRLVYERGVFDAEATDLVSEAMVWWSISLPVPGGEPAVLAHLLQPPARLGHDRADGAEHGAQRRARRRSCTTRSASAASCSARWSGRSRCALLQGWMLRGDLGGIEGARTAGVVARMLVAAALLAGVAYGAWYGARRAARRRAGGRRSRRWGPRIAAGFAVYAAAVWVLRMPEARQFRSLLPRG